MLPNSREADQLRAAMRTAILNNYTDAAWGERVPVHMHETCSRQQFADLYLGRPATHLPHDCIALWQDMRRNDVDVYILVQDTHGERVERIRCDTCDGRSSREALVLLFTWSGAGHYEVVTYVTYGNVMVLPTKHAFIEHLDVLHTEYVDRLSKEEKRRNSSRKWAPANDVGFID